MTGGVLGEQVLAMATTENQDQEILAQKDAIAKEIADNIPLVGEKQGISVLQEEFANDVKFLDKAKHLSDDYTHLRRTRPDGNCFFRAVGFRYFEVLMTDADERKRFMDKVIKPSKEQFEKLGYSSYTMEDFYDTFVEKLELLSQEGFDTKKLVEMFNTQDVSDYLVVFLRFLTSKYLQQNADFFQAFMEDKSVKEFCSADVEAMYIESDNIHVIGLSQDIGVKIRIMYLDRSEGKEGEKPKAQALDFPDEKEGAPKIQLLYRPGHYDVLYPKE